MVDREVIINAASEEQDIYNPYIALFDFFDSRYRNDTDRTNYADVLKTMLGKSKIKQLIVTYNKVLKKLLQFTYGGDEYISSSWYSDGLTTSYNWVWESLKAYLNDQIKRVFEETPYSDKLALECIVNLREGRNQEQIRCYILSKSSDDVKALVENLISCQRRVLEAPKHMSPYNMDTNDYREYKPKYIDDIKFLIKKGYHKGYNDVYFEMQTNVIYMPDAKSYLLMVFVYILVLGIYMLFVWLLLDLGFLGIIIAIGLPGALIKFLKG